MAAIPMKLEINRQSDSKGFWLRSKLMTVSFHFWGIWRYQKTQLWGWNAKIIFGRGAGCVWGRTAYLAWRAKGGVLWSKKPKPLRKLRVGFTQNANAIPYSFLTY